MTRTGRNRKFMKNLSFSIHTLGCKVNQYESERMVSELNRVGWDRVDFSSRADVYIINTCTVTAVASHKSRQLIRRALKSNPEATVVVTGCYADSDRDEISAIDGVGLVVGNEDKGDLPRLLADRLGVYIPDTISEDTSEKQMHTRALVKVQDGCNNFCSYCIVPYVRGDLWTRPEHEIVDEVSRLVAGGTREVVLTGIHLGLYGEGTNTGLGELMAKLVDIRGLGRIRLSSIELNEVTPEIIEIVSSSDKVCNHLHIPLQSGSDNVLSRMNRHYTAEEFIKRTDELRERIENLAITTDIIVGFPGETESEFEDTLKLVERVGFSKLHVFKYSPRKGTPAATFSDQVPNKVKDSRSARLIELGKRLSLEFASGYVGKNLSVLVEREQEGLLSGVSDNYIRVSMEGPSDIIGGLVNIKVNRQEEEVLYGEIKRTTK